MNERYFFCLFSRTIANQTIQNKTKQKKMEQNKNKNKNNTNTKLDDATDGCE